MRRPRAHIIQRTMLEPVVGENACKEGNMASVLFAQLSDYVLRCTLAKVQGDAKRGPTLRGMHAEKDKQNTHAAVVIEMSIAERKLYNC